MRWIERLTGYVVRNLIGFIFLACSFIAIEGDKLTIASTHFLILAVYCFLMSELLEIKDKLK